MRLSRLFLPTERQPPADAEAVSHKLMVRAGLVRQVGAGLWSWLPAGWRTHQKVVQIVREEIDAIGGQEMLMPVMHPAELWKKSGRYGFPEQFRLQDRKGAEHVLAMTHEEVVTMHVAAAIRSYRDLPKILYHFQVKERDEPRPRAGVLRTREFIMKDSYTLRPRRGGPPGRLRPARARPTRRSSTAAACEWYEVESDVGMMGGSMAHEYMAPCASGENDVALAPGYAANTEIASADAQPVEATTLTRRPRRRRARRRSRPSPAMVGAPPGQLLKAFPIVLDGGERVDVFVRGDHRVNEIKLRNALGSEFRPAREDEIGRPAGLPRPVERRADGVRRGDRRGPVRRRAPTARASTRSSSVEAGERLDVRTVVEGDTVNGNPITIEPAIEIGNIFKLNTRYSEPLGATYLDENGKEQLVYMGSYGIGPARIAAAAVEQFHDEQGIALAEVDRALRRRDRRRSASPAATRRAPPRASTTSCGRSASTSCSTTAPPARARSSPTPSCSACRCG